MTDNNSNNIAHSTSPTFRLRWSWFPSLLFSDGMLPSVLILTMVMMRRFGMNNAQIAVYLALLCLPFVLRPLFEMVVAHFRGTTKVWILSAEFISTLSLWSIAFTLPTNYWQQGTMCFMLFVIVSGIIHNIAVRRFYLDEPTIANTRQKMFAMLFRGISMLFGIGIIAMLVGNIEVLTRNVRYSWGIVFYIMAGINCFMWLWHSIFLPGGRCPFAKPKDLFGMHRNEYNSVVDDMTRGLCNRMTLLSLMLYVVSIAFVSIVAPLMYIDAPHNGGLGLSPQEFGLSFGTIGIAAMFIGSRIGYNAINKYGKLRHWLLPMTLILTLYILTLLYLSYHMAATFAAICISTLFGFIALGFGLSAYHIIVERFAIKRIGTELRRAIAISLMSLTMVLAGAVSGPMQIDIGYRQFFLLATCLHIIPVTIAGIYTFYARKQNL